MNIGRLHRLALLIAAASLPLAACGTQTASDGPGAGSGDGRPDDGQYVATSVTVAGADRPLVPGSTITLTLDGGRVVLNAGCNTMSGDARWTSDGLTVGPLAMTEMGCDPALMDQDAWLAGVFDGTLRLGTDPEGFTLTRDDTTLVFGRPAAAPVRDLRGTRWVVDSIGTGGGDDGTVSSAPAGTSAWLQIDGDQLRVFLGCNSGAGTLTQRADTLTVSVRALTEMACGEARDRFESDLLAFFTDPVTFAIDGDTLTLTADDGRFYGFHAEDPEEPVLEGDYTSSGAPSPPFPEGGEIRLTLGDGAVTFSAACNVMTAPATWDGGVLRLTGKVTRQTTKPCASPTAEQDSWLQDFFSSEPRLLLDGNDLRVRSGGTTIWFVPPDPGTVEPDAPDATLEGVRWLLTGVGEYDGDAGSVMGLPTRGEAWLRLDAGRATVHTGCNRGSATYEIAGDTLRFGPLMLTKMACRSGYAEIEDAIRAVLSSDEVAWAVSGTELRLTAPTAHGSLELVFAAR